MPRIAADQDGYENTSLHRKFGYLQQRCLIESEIKISGLEQDLFELDHRVAAADAQSLASGASSIRSELADLPSQVSATVEKCNGLLLSYCETTP